VTRPEPKSSSAGTGQDLASSPRFRAGLAALAKGSGETEAALLGRARRYLHELRSRHDPRVQRWFLRGGRALLDRGYSRIDYDPAQVERMREVFARWPTVVLASHKSYLDGGALNIGFADHGLPPLTVFGGINMAFWPVGSLWRRAGMVFIRRGSEDPLYRYTLRQYLGSLIEHRQHLQWFIEGTRSRTGKLGPPRLGLLSYVVEAYAGGRVSDVLLVPVSIAYDQLREVEEYATEARGASKQAESLGWLLRFIRSQRGRFGTIYVRFGEPVSVRDALGDGLPEGPERRRLDLQKLGFEVAARINDATPITGSALVAIALLGARGRSLTAQEIRAACAGYVDFAHRTGLPMAPTARLEHLDDVTCTLVSLRDQGIVNEFRDGREPVYGLDGDMRLAAAYYRNTLVHFFVVPAIAELALLAAAASPSASRGQAFEACALELRDLLKFDFFFRERDEFLAALRAETARLAPGWPSDLSDGPDGVLRLLQRLPTLSSDMMLRSFFEAYAVVADALVELGDCNAPGEAELVDRCMGLAGQYRRQNRLRNPESASRHLIRSGVALARHRGLLDAGDDLPARREAFAQALRDVLKRMSVVHRVGAERVATETRLG
jgi:glycerol-3-phosphate O-acyltransferase